MPRLLSLLALLASAAPAPAQGFSPEDAVKRMKLPDGFSAELDAHTGDGTISSQLPITVSGALNKSSLRGNINHGGATLMVRTGDGSIRIERI